MGNGIITTDAQSHWMAPGTMPESAGEYRAALSPAQVQPEVRRWWSGTCWSKPYRIDWPEALKAQTRKTSDDLWPYWLPN